MTQGQSCVFNGSIINNWYKIYWPSADLHFSALSLSFKEMMSTRQDRASTFESRGRLVIRKYQWLSLKQVPYNPQPPIDLASIDPLWDLSGILTFLLRCKGNWGGNCGSSTEQFDQCVKSTVSYITPFIIFSVCRRGENIKDKPHIRLTRIL